MSYLWNTLHCCPVTPWNASRIMLWGFCDKLIVQSRRKNSPCMLNRKHMKPGAGL